MFDYKKTALYLGRFQPFHKGHLDAIKQIFAKKDIEQLIIAIGSAENDFLPKNPFTAGERFEMIMAGLIEAGFERNKFLIIPIRDVGRSSVWAAHARQLLPRFSKVFSGSPLVRHLFSFEKDIDICAIKKRIKINATEVRKRMKTNENWQKLVPQSVATLIKEFNGCERLWEILED